MSKPVIAFVFKVLRNGLLRCILDTCPNLVVMTKRSAQVGWRKGTKHCTRISRAESAEKHTAIFVRRTMSFIPVFIYPRWCRISSINSMLTILVDWNLGSISQTTTTFPSSIFFDGRLVSIFFRRFSFSTLWAVFQSHLSEFGRDVFFLLTVTWPSFPASKLENSSLT